MVLHEISLLISIISPNKLKEGGAAMLEDLNKNHHKVILGIKLISPLFKKSLRLPRRSYEIFERQNKPEEQRPCEIIITKAPRYPQLFKVLIPPKTIPMWDTDEYAIKDLISL